MTDKTSDTIPAPPRTEPQNELPNYGGGSLQPAPICLICDAMDGNHDPACPFAMAVSP